MTGIALVLLAIIAAVLLTRAHAFPSDGQPSGQADLYCVRLAYWPQITADVTDAGVKAKALFPGRIIGVLGRGRALGGGTPFTDVDVEILKGTDDILSADLPVVDGSALTAGGTLGTLHGTSANLNVAAGDVFHMKLIDVTGGASTPTLDGLEVEIWIQRR